MISRINVTVREAAGVPGWAGGVDADLSAYREFKLALRLADETANCGVMFITAGTVLTRSLIRGSGRMPGETPKVRTRPREQGNCNRGRSDRLIGAVSPLFQAVRRLRYRRSVEPVCGSA